MTGGVAALETGVLTAVMTASADQLRRITPRLFAAPTAGLPDSQEQTRDAFSTKWGRFRYDGDAFRNMMAFQQRRYLDLYGFASEQELAEQLRSCRTIIDCGAGMAGQAAWFASLAPQALVVAVDISDSIAAAAHHFQDRLTNLVFIQADIGHLPFLADGVFDYVNCDQVIHHTAQPERTFAELVRLTRPGRQLTCYVYRRKALPRELVDEFFRERGKAMSHDEVVALSEQVTALGRMLDGLDTVADFPAVPALGIEGGRQSVQRFIYWNFLKCFWNPDLGWDASVMTNYDWYAPAQAARYDEAEFREWIARHGLDTLSFHAEPASYSGRFQKP
ncbi:MAG: class I SAM-dependent methyltransferase [Magnetospirillum sp.]|nr:MAG: class I SAM-dependent methyltransferase [Magnetospirillum sp.]